MQLNPAGTPGGPWAGNESRAKNHFRCTNTNRLSSNDAIASGLLLKHVVLNEVKTCQFDIKNLPYSNGFYKGPYISVR